MGCLEVGIRRLVSDDVLFLLGELCANGLILFISRHDCFCGEEEAGVVE